MIDLELLGANGDAIVMTDSDGHRYKLVIDDALRAAVRRDRTSTLSSPVQAQPGASLTPREIQTLLRSGASAEEVAATTGIALEHVRRFEGPVSAERAWAVEQARACRIGWEKDSPVLGELVVDRLATRGVDPGRLEWDAVRDGRAPWEVLLTFVQGAEEKQARWVLDLTSRAVTALDDEARWLTEAASGTRRPTVFDQDSQARGASAQSPARAQPAARGGSRSAGSPSASSPASGASTPITVSRSAQGPVPRPEPHPESTDALLADLAASRGQRVEPVVPEESGAIPVQGGPKEPVSPPASQEGAARVVSIAERRRGQAGKPSTSNHPAGKRLPQAKKTEPQDDDRTAAAPVTSSAFHESPTKETEQVLSQGSQDELPDMPEAPAAKSKKEPPAPKSKRRSRRSVPSWDEIVFGSKPE